MKGKKPMTSILRKANGSAGGPKTDQSSSDSAEDKEKPTSLKVDMISVPQTQAKVAQRSAGLRVKVSGRNDQRAGSHQQSLPPFTMRSRRNRFSKGRPVLS